jgi:hypothetical protein
MSGAMRRASVGALLLLSVVACQDTGAHPLIVVDATAAASGTLFLDLNGSAVLELAADQPVSGWQVRLIGPNRAVVATAVSDSLGFFVFDKVPTGRVTLEIDQTRLGDSLLVFGSNLGREISLTRGDTLKVTIGFTYPKVSMAAVDTLPLGRRVFVEGLALNPVTITGTRDLHLRSGSRALRVTNIVRKPVAPGDSVRVLGRRATELGRAVLTGGEITVIRLSVADPEPYELTTRNASLANNGVLSADLARIRGADLVQSRNELSDVILTVDDGTGPLEIVLRSFLGSDASVFKPDSVRIRDATGLLLPYVTDAGETRWRLAPRLLSDLRIEPEPRKTAPPPASAGTSPAQPERKRTGSPPDGR